MMHTLAKDKSQLQYKNLMCSLVASICKLAESLPRAAYDIHLIKVKLARKAFKLGSSIRGFVHDSVLEASESAYNYLTGKWNEILDRDDSYRQTPKIRVPQEGLEVELHNSTDHLFQVLLLHTDSGLLESFVPDCPPRIQVGAYGLPSSNTFVTCASNIHLILMDFEVWVGSELRHLTLPKSDEPMQILRSLIDSYISSSTKAYVNMPEQLSTMLLTALELWVALDRVALEVYPLLEEYSPDIPITILKPYLLPQAWANATLEEIGNLSRTETWQRT